MPKTKRKKPEWHMCQNDVCPEYRVATKLLGGCGCGEGLVAFVPEHEPTLRQMAEFVSSVANADPKLPNLTVEDAERELEHDEISRLRLIAQLGQLEGSIDASRRESA